MLHRLFLYQRPGVVGAPHLWRFPPTLRRQRFACRRTLPIGQVNPEHNVVYGDRAADGKIYLP
jgi:hypothetical protein